MMLMSTASPLVSVRRPVSTRWLIALAATLVPAAILWLFLEVLLVASVWPEVETPPRQGEAVLASSLASGAPVHDPAALAAAVREPQNTWSCLAFLLVGAVILQGTRDALGKWLAVTLAIAGVAAMLYHASATRMFRQGDIAGLYWTGGLVCWLAATRLGVLGPRAGSGRVALVAWLGFGLLAIVLTALRNVQMAEFKPLQLPVVTAVLGLLVGSMVLVFCLRQADARTWRFGLGAIVAISVGFVLQYGDRPGGFWCVPGSWVQPHAVWHVLCALALALMVECFDAPPRAPAGRVNS